MTHIDLSSLNISPFASCHHLQEATEEQLPLAARHAAEWMDGWMDGWMDKKSYRHWCWLDLLFDILGCAVGYNVHCLIF